MMQYPPLDSSESRLAERDGATAAETALATIRDRILTGALEPGTKLHQGELARDLGMSRIPVRDAIRALAGEGLVSQDPHRTAVVAPLSADDLNELYELRIAIEPHASAVALTHVSEDVLASMGRDLAAMAEAGDSATWLEAHDRFHSSLYRHSSRPRMVALLDRARAQTRRYTWIRLDRDAAEISAEHGLIHSAARRRDPRSLRVLVKAHLVASHEIVTRRLESVFHGQMTGPKGGDVRRATA